jgi:hypothetical protein
MCEQIKKFIFQMMHDLSGIEIYMIYKNEKYLASNGKIYVKNKN